MLRPGENPDNAAARPVHRIGPSLIPQYLLALLCYGGCGSRQAAGIGTEDEVNPVFFYEPAGGCLRAGGLAGVIVVDQFHRVGRPVTDTQPVSDVDVVHPSLNPGQSLPPLHCERAGQRHWQANLDGRDEYS